MLDWLSSSAQNAQRDSEHDNPETPAHIFAARAFKSALFGTPAPPQDIDSRSLAGLDLANPTSIGPIASPAKGILLTPGTVTARRKTVTFGGANDNEKCISLNEARDGLTKEEQNLDQKHGETDTNIESKAIPAGDRKSIRRSLFNRPKKLGGTESVSASLWSVPEDEPTGTKTAVANDTQADVTADLTVDLQQPRSVSGKHWMQEYQRDHALSKAEMKKLIKYSQDAKNHASEHQREATGLRGELDQSRDRIRSLEEHVAKLEQEAKTNQQNAGTHVTASQSESKATPDSSASTNIELETLRKVAAEATIKASKLERENESFRRTILRVKDEMARYENRNKQWIEQRKKKDERHAAQRKALKEKVIAYRTRLQGEFDAFQVKTAQEQAGLLREIELLRKDLSTTSPEKRRDLGTDDAIVESSGIASGEQLRQLLARSHDRSPEKQQKAHNKREDLTRLGETRNAKDSRSSRSKQAKSALQRLRDETRPATSSQALNSSPTILQSHIQHASRKSMTNQIDTDEGNNDGLASIILEPESPRHTLIPYSLNEPGSDAEDYDLPVITKRETSDKSNTNNKLTANRRPAKKEHRVHSRHGLTGGRHANASAAFGVAAAATAAIASSTGLTPEREAAARLRIAQRSAEKQKSRRFLFGNGTEPSGRAFGGKENVRRSAGVLSERQLNRL